jgi:DNA-directed RNA polymerase subunit M/transcription elongation factor TFIIS
MNCPECGGVMVLTCGVWECEDCEYSCDADQDLMRQTGDEPE